MTKEELEKFYAGEMAQIMDCGHVVCDIFYVGTNRRGYPVIGKVTSDVTGVNAYIDIEPEILLKTARLKPKPKVKKTGWITVSDCGSDDSPYIAVTSFIHSTADELQQCKLFGERIIKIEWEEDAK